LLSIFRRHPSGNKGGVRACGDPRADKVLALFVSAPTGYSGGLVSGAARRLTPCATALSGLATTAGVGG
jgi:hypothetical protein